MGLDQPDFGVVFDDMACTEVVTISCLLQPKVEAEIAFVLEEDLADGPLDLDEACGAVHHAVAALEIVDSRVAGWDISFGDTVADNASSGLNVLGAEPVPLGSFEPIEVTIEMTLGGEIVSTGTGAACLGDPHNPLSWLARKAREFGVPLCAGQVILSGALGPMVPIDPGAS